MLTTGAWRQMERQTVRSGRFGSPVPDETADVERGDRLRRDAKIREIVWQLTQGKPRLVKTAAGSGRR